MKTYNTNLVCVMVSLTSHKEHRNWNLENPDWQKVKCRFLSKKLKKIRYIFGKPAKTHSDIIKNQLGTKNWWRIHRLVFTTFWQPKLHEILFVQTKYFNFKGWKQSINRNWNYLPNAEIVTKTNKLVTLLISTLFNKN